MKNFLLFMLLIFFIPGILMGQANRSEPDTAAGMSLEELLNLQVSIEVASTKGDNIFRSPSTVTVISKDDIRKYGYSSISEALQTVAGLSVERTYLKRNLPTGRGLLQDHYANKVLILINGISSWNAVTGEGNLDRVMIEDVERIEVLKGPSSILYGTNAYSAAINIVLRRTDSNAFFAHAGYGMRGSYEAGASANLKQNALEGFISLHRINTQGPDKPFTDELNVTKDINDYLDTYSGNLSLKYKSHSITGTIFRSEESYYGVTPQFKQGAGNPHLVEGLLGNYTFNHNFSRWLNLKAGGSYDYGSRDISRSANDSIRAAISGYRINAFLRANYAMNSHFSIELGGDIEKRFSKEYRNYLVYNDSTIANNGMADKSLIEYSGFGQIQGNFNKLTLLLGGRFTANKLFGNNLSPRFTGVYALNDKNAIKFIGIGV